MPYTEEQKRLYLSQAGFNPDEYDIDDEGGAFLKPPQSQFSPPSSPDSNAIVTPVAPQPTTSALPAFGRAAASSIVPTAGGLLSGVGTGALGGSLFGPPGTVIGGIVGGIAGSYGASKLQEAVLPDSINQQLALDAQQHPVASFAGGFVPSMVAFNPIKGIQSLPTLAKGVGKMATLNGEALTAGEKAATLNAALNAGTSAGQNIYSQLQGDQPFNPLELAGHTAMGLIMNEPNRVGQRLGFHSPMEIDTQLAAQRNLVLEQARIAAEQARLANLPPEPNPLLAQTPQPGIAPRVETYGKPVDMLGSELGNRRQRGAMSKYKGAIEPVDIHTFEGEGGGNFPVERDVDFQLARQEVINEQMRNTQLQTEQAKQQAEQLRQQNDQLQKSLTENQVRITKPSLERNLVENQISPVAEQPFSIGNTPDYTKRMTEGNQQVARESAEDLRMRRLEEGNRDKYSSESSLEPKDIIGHVDSNDAVNAVRVPDAYSAVHHENGMPSESGDGWRYIAKKNKVMWNKRPAADKMYAVDNHLSKHGYDNLIHTDSYDNKIIIPKYQSPEPKPHPFDKLTWEQLPVTFKNKVLELAKRRGISVEQARQIIDPRTGQEKLGSFTDSTRTAKVSDTLGRGDTGPHEIAHGYLDDLLNSAHMQDRKLAQDALDIFGGDREMAEEALVMRLGKEGHERITNMLDGSALTRFKEFFKDFVSRAKYKTGLGNDEDVIRHLSQRQVTDAPFGMRGEIDLTRPKYAGYQKGAGDIPGTKLFNLQEDIKDEEGNILHAKGSTVSEGTLKERGVKFQSPEEGDIKLKQLIEDAKYTIPEGYKNHDEFVNSYVKNFAGDFEQYKNESFNKNRDLEQLKVSFAQEKANNALENYLEDAKKLGFSNEEFLRKLRGDEDTKYSSKSALDIPFLKPEITKIEKQFGPEGEKVAKGFTKFYEDFRQLRGKLTNSIVGELRQHLNFANPKELATQNNEKLNKVRQYMDDVADNGSSTITLSPEEKQIEQSVRDFMLATLNEKNSRPGLPTTNANEDYFPHVMSRDVLNTLLNKTGSERAKLIQDFLDYHKSIGTPDPEEALKIFMAGYKNADKNLAEAFGPIDKSAGVGIPQSWREKNLIDRMSRYGNRYARRIAYHDAVEANPEVVKALEDPKTGIQNSDIVRNVMDDIAGRKEHEEAKRTAISGVIRAGMLGPLTGAKDFVANLTLGLQHQTPSQSILSLMHAWGNMKDSLEGSFRSGVNRYNVASFEFGDGGIDNLTNILRSARDILNTVQGRNLVERMTRATAWGQGKFLAMDNLEAMVKGKPTSQGRKFLEDFGEGIDIGKAIKEKEFSPEDLDKIAARYVESVQGTYDYRGLPSVAQRGSLAPVLSLARWNIEKMNNFMKYNIEPARQGNFTPLLMSTIGMLIGGEAVTKLVEAASGRREKNPSMEEVTSALKEGKEGSIPAAAYKLAALSSMAGYAGMLGDVVKSAMDVQFKNRPTGYNNPLIDGVTQGVDLMQDVVEAIRNGDLDITADAISKVLETYFQAYRLGLNQLSTTTKEQAEKSNKLRDLKVYKQLEGLPVGDTSGVIPNPFLNKEMREFKREDNMEEAMKLLPDLLRRAFEKSEGDPERLKSELTKLKINNYETMPSLERTPIAFFRYLNYLKSKGGEQLAQERLADYMRQNMLNKVKSGMIPNF